MSLNKVMLIGNLGADPEIRSLPNGDSVASLSVATSEKWKDKKTGQPAEKTEWHRVSFFGKPAEIIAQYCTKGSALYIEGQLSTRKYQAQDGSDRYITEIKGRTFKFLNSPNAPGQPHQAQQPQSGHSYTPQNPSRQSSMSAPTTAQQPAPGGFDNFDDDIPF